MFTNVPQDRRKSPKGPAKDGSEDEYVKIFKTLTTGL